VTAFDVCKTSDMTHHFAEIIRTLPRRRKCANPARRHSADGVQLAVIRNIVLFFDFGNQLIKQKIGITVTQLIIFITAVGAAEKYFGKIFAGMPRIDEQSDGDRHLFFCDQIVKNNSCAKISVFADIGMTVLKNHQRGRF
jgi:hypothetical protein